MLTSRYHAIVGLERLGVVRAFVPVRTSLGTPEWVPGAGGWPKAETLLPKEAFGIEDPAEFRRIYRHRLHKIGVSRITAELQAIAAEHDGLPLALLCYENIEKARCHRTLAAEFWEEHAGQVIPELNTAEEIADYLAGVQSRRRDQLWMTVDEEAGR